MTNTPTTKRRKPLAALLMSLILPGLGQLYNGAINKAVWLFLIITLLSVPAVLLATLYLPADWMIPTLLGSIGLVLLVWLYSMVDAFRSARRQPDYALLGWQCSGVYVLVFLLWNMLALPLLLEYVSKYQVESFKVPSASMEPTVMTGDMLFADKRYNRPGTRQAVQRGDIAIFVYPNDRTTYFIKRIVGLPGDKIQIRSNEVLINGKSTRVLSENVAGGLRVTETDGKRNWQVFWASNKPTLLPSELTVPPGQVFVLGDNRNDSHDSRVFGTIPLQDVIGKARQVWLSLDNKAQQVRWERSGKVLQ
ncbi:MAG TPA: signal peptidase I [Candidatus Thiothrix moscowensis]|uniref:signal peptidase I n=1 Tax=unclassified Thiothrix TaxID=2636184 RepID=UPI0025EADF19|nr:MULTISPECIES: signal peptidase I [unclassified Thiothrix]HRJ54241.1 signal peptidase I [Candidatus Thiothrix moscowensis]HRJ94507.1 signal peptidase I [Candidatus Thiothrix moscowensis]